MQVANLLTTEWQNLREIADKAGKSRKDITDALSILVDEYPVERRVKNRIIQYRWEFQEVEGAELKYHDLMDETKDCDCDGPSSFQGVSTRKIRPGWLELTIECAECSKRETYNMMKHGGDEVF